MDDANIQELNGLKPKKCKAKVELLGSYDPSGEIIIRDPYYVCNLFAAFIFMQHVVRMRDRKIH